MTDTDAPPLTCQELVELVTGYLDGALSAAERERFDRHLRDCDPCVEFVAQIERTIALTGRLDPDGVDPSARDRLLAEFRGWRGGRPNATEPAGGTDLH
jgi:anti-sigma factor RsiW